MENILPALKARGLVEAVTDEEALGRELASRMVTVYAGFDPTADSLHVGHLLAVMMLLRFQRAGHRPIVVIGGATGMIGDPSGKSAERVLLTQEVVDRNLVGMGAQLERFLDFGEAPNAAIMVNNYDWLGKWSIVDFLRDVGKHFPLGYMLGKDSVRRREEAGISYTEFSYMLLQAADFAELHRRYDCTLQVGGGDQWGNITAGVEYLRRSAGVTAHGMTTPLLMTASGVKFGKTEAGAVWLSAERTSPYQLYQYFLNADDRDVLTYLNYFTLLSDERLAELARAVAERPERREAQRVLAEEVTRLVHGEAALAGAQRASQVLFGGEVAGLSDQVLAEIFADAPSIELPRARLAAGLPLLDLLVEARAVGSKGEGRTLIRGGGLYLNNERVTEEGMVLTEANLASEHALVVRAGKKKYYLVRVSS